MVELAGLSSTIFSPLLSTGVPCNHRGFRGWVSPPTNHRLIWHHPCEKHVDESCSLSKWSVQTPQRLIMTSLSFTNHAKSATNLCTVIIEWHIIFHHFPLPKNREAAHVSSYHWQKYTEIHIGFSNLNFTFGTFKLQAFLANKQTNHPQPQQSCCCTFKASNGSAPPLKLRSEKRSCGDFGKHKIQQHKS